MIGRVQPIYDPQVQTSQQIFTRWLRERIVPALRAHGYAGSGQDFHRRFGRNWAALNVQRDRYSTSDELRFTLNLGTKSALVSEEQGADPEIPAREIDCDWRARIGELTPSPPNAWWVIRADMHEDQLSVLSETVRDLLVRTALPGLERMADDRALLDFTTTSPRPMAPVNLDISAPILRAIGPRGAFEEMLSAIDLIGAQALDRFRYQVVPGRQPGPRQTSRLVADLRSSNLGRRALAAGDLGGASPSTELQDSLVVALGDPAAAVRGFAAQSLGRLGVTSAVAALLDQLDHDRAPMAAVGAGIGLCAMERTLPPDIRAARRAVLSRRHADAAGSHRGAFMELLRLADLADQGPAERTPSQVT
jgi:hypothetical protein